MAATICGPRRSWMKPAMTYHVAIIASPIVTTHDVCARPAELLLERQHEDAHPVEHPERHVHHHAADDGQPAVRGHERLLGLRSVLQLPCGAVTSPAARA